MNAIVIGAGATGLAAAYLLAREGHAVTVLEASAEPGGLLATFDVGDGTRLERFYHHFFTHDAELHWLLDELGLGNRVRYHATSMGIARDGDIYPFDGPLDLLRFDAIPLTDRLRFGVSAAALSYLPGFESAEATPALAWFRRYAGRAATDAIWEPMLRIKFGDAAGRIPLAWMAGRLRQRVRSRSGTTEHLGYLDGSLQVLVDHLVDALHGHGVVLRTGVPVRQLVMEKGRVRGVATEDGVLPADAVVSTVPTPILAGWTAPHDAAYTATLRRIDYMGALCTVLAFDAHVSPAYWLNVADPGFDFGGVIEQTRLIPPAAYGGRHIVYLSRYLAHTDPLWRMADDELLRRQVTQLEELVGRPLRNQVQQHWVFRGTFAAPVTDLGFAERIPAYRSPLPGLFVAAMPHVYPDERSTNNSIRVAAAAVAAMGVDTGYVPAGTSLAATYGHSPTSPYRNPVRSTT